MTKTSTDVIAEALRRIRVLANDDPATADDNAYAKDHLDALFEELTAAPHSFPFTWDVETVPDGLYRPLAWLLAVDLAPHYLVQSEPRSRAVMRLREIAFPNDTPLHGDSDEDGTVTEAESEAAKRAAYY